MLIEMMKRICKYMQIKEKGRKLFLLFVFLLFIGIIIFFQDNNRKYIDELKMKTENNQDEMIEKIPFASQEKTDEDIEPTLYAKTAVLMDAANQRVLWGKDENTQLPMASTTKIMTCILAIEYGNENPLEEQYAEVSAYATTQPKVKANLRKGEKYRMLDLLYSMMLESHNDTAVVVAEHIGKWLLKKESVSSSSVEESKIYVKAFTDWMNEKAKELGCKQTHFVTPNGLDAQDEGGIHATTARELALIASYAIQNPFFRELIKTSSYSFTDLEGKHTISANNKDAFLQLNQNAIGIKTGFTNQAGYCFVGAIDTEENIFISVVLGCGWPPEKTRKWNDTQKMMSYGTTYFTKQKITMQKTDTYIKVRDGIDDFCYAANDETIQKEMLLSPMDKIEIYKYVVGFLNAPVKKGTIVGMKVLKVNGEIICYSPICALDNIEKWNIKYCVKKTVNLWLL